MKWTGLNDIRESYLSFFESKGHLRLPSASLVPHGDPSLLLVNAGMAPLKKYFQGLETPPSKRVTTCQKCIRTPDIEQVGKTSRHGTYFEMLGNFSFGDYFKEEAITWAWEYIVDVMKLPPERIWISVYEEDDEAYDIWTKKVGVSPDKVVKLGKEDNFWELDSGPCGPCSEMHFDMGEDRGCGKDDCGIGCECDRYVEFWNLVFTQFDSDGKGNYAKLAHPNIDTGMGLERLACIMQGVDNIFEVDTVSNIMKKVSSIAKVDYKKGEMSDVSLRVITDHIRSTTFMISDGVMPSNEGRGYVLRRLIRRAARHGRLLGINGPFLYKVCDTVIDENLHAYPELDENREFIERVMRTEEESFAKTIEKGMELLTSEIKKLASLPQKEKTLLGKIAFKLHDTFGFPIDLTREILEEKGIGYEEKKFHELMKAQREKARSARKSSDVHGWGGEISSEIASLNTEFIGYASFATDANIVGMYSGNQNIDSASKGDDVIIVLDRTPFYAESGGQVGDAGTIEMGDASIKIEDTRKAPGGQTMHLGTVEEGTFNRGDTVKASVDESLRKATMRNHTCAHLLQAALQEVLGDHVHQAGQMVDNERCRFDFSHFNAMTKSEIEEVERICNRQILEGKEVKVSEMPLEEAKSKGVIALFGEKYGDIVRVIEIEGFSAELCGGTHVDNTSKLGLMKIISESSVASGVRRIEAVTGDGVLELIDDSNRTIFHAAKALKLNNLSELVTRCKTLVNDLKDREKQIDELNQKMAKSQLDNIIDGAKQVNGFTVITAEFPSVSNDALRKMGDTIKDKYPNAIAVIAGTSNKKSTLLAICGKSAVKMGAHAGKIVSQVAAITGSKGGGRPDSAMAGVGDIDKLPEALNALESIVEEI